MGSNGSPVGWGVGGPLLMMIGDAMTPFDPKGDPIDAKFDVTVYDVKLVSMLKIR